MHSYVQTRANLVRARTGCNALDSRARCLWIEASRGNRGVAPDRRVQFCANASAERMGNGAIVAIWRYADTTSSNGTIAVGVGPSGTVRHPSISPNSPRRGYRPRTCESVWRRYLYNIQIWLRMTAPSSNSNQGGSKKKPADNDPFFQNFDWSGFRFPNEQTETTTVDDRDETTVITLAKEYGMPIDAVFDWFEIHLRMTIPSPSQQINEDRAQKFRDYHQTRRE